MQNLIIKTGSEYPNKN